MGIAIANRKNRYDFGALSLQPKILGKHFQPQAVHGSMWHLAALALEMMKENDRGREKHINFFNINCLAPAQKGPPEKVYVPHFLGKNAKEGPT